MNTNTPSSSQSFHRTPYIAFLMYFSIIFLLFSFSFDIGVSSAVKKYNYDYFYEFEANRDAVDNMFSYWMLGLFLYLVAGLLLTIMVYKLSPPNPIMAYVFVLIISKGAFHIAGGLSWLV